jgi:hypothetical protein
MKQSSASTDCNLLPEMVDDAMGQLAMKTEQTTLNIFCVNGI